MSTKPVRMYVIIPSSFTIILICIMKIIIVILTVNNYSDTKECIDSVKSLDYEGFEIAIVDNGSTDNSLSMLEREYPDLSYVRIKDNCGFAGGMNEGLRYAIREEADFVWLLNNDIAVDKQSLSRLLDAVQAVERVGIVGSKVYYYSSPNKINFAGGRVSKITGRTYHKGTGTIDNGEFSEIEEVNFLTGASLFVNATMLEQVGLFDETYFLFYEDADLVIRANRMGWKTIFAPDSIIWHKISLTTKSGDFSNAYYGVRNSLFFCKKHFPYLLPFCIISNAWQYIALGLIKLLLSRSASKELKNIRMAFIGFVDFFRNNMGKCKYDDRWF